MYSLNIASLLWQVAATLKLVELPSNDDSQCWVDCLYVLDDNADKLRIEKLSVWHSRLKF